MAKIHQISGMSEAGMLCLSEAGRLEHRHDSGSK
jgi:hypothetical protein